MKFKVGDVVRVVKISGCHGEPPVGHIGKIVNCTTINYYIDNYSTFLYESEIESIEAFKQKTFDETLIEILQED